MGTPSPVSEPILQELETLLRERRYSAFAHRINETVQQYGASGSLCRLTAAYARLTNSPAALRQSLVQWSSLEPADPEPLLQLAVLLARQGTHTQALDALYLAEQTGNRMLEVQVCRARLTILMARFEDAVRAAEAGMTLAESGSAEAVFLQGLHILAGNLLAAMGRAEIRGLVETVASRVARLQADSRGLYLSRNGAALRLKRPDRKPGLVDELTSQIKSRSCGCVIGSADVLDLAGPAARVHDGSFWGSRSRVYVVECDEDMLALALAAFDVRSILTDEAVTWIWGPTALEQLERCLLEREDESPQNITVSSNPQVAPIVEKASRVFYQKVGAWFGEASTYYANLPREHWGDVLGDSPSRPPRILLITTEFSSFMKFSIRDLASAFERMGWQVQVAKESQPTHRMTGLTVPKAVATFRPDLIWQINFMRNAWQGGVPDGVPFVCWDQDVMFHMTDAQQARRVGRFDFLAHLGTGLNYIRKYGYPKDQMIPMPMCVDASLFYADPTSVPDMDICYVSHHGRTLDRRIQQVLEVTPPGQEGLFRPLIQEYAARLERAFMDSGYPLRPDECREVLVEVCSGCRMQFETRNLDVLADRLYRLVANTLWRHQAVRMAAACDVRLRLYGQGWEDNPEFSRFAAGTVEYGQPLAEAMRSSHVALQAVLTGNEHQRLWEAAACGSIVLMRYHPADEGCRTVRNWLEQLERGAGRPVDEVITALDRRSLAGHAGYKIVRTSMCAEDGILTDEVLECARYAVSFRSVRDKLGDAYEDMAFRTQEELREKLGRILLDERHRAGLRERLLEAAGEHTYLAQLPRVIRRIRERLLA